MSITVCEHDMQLRVVRAVAVLGGLLQMFLFMCLSGIAALVRFFLPWEVFQFVDQWLFPIHCLSFLFPFFDVFSV